MIGLKVVEASPFALVFDVDGAQLRIQKVEKVVSVPYTVLGWSVETIEKTVHDLASRGVEFERYDHFDQDDSGIWDTPSITQS